MVLPGDNVRLFRLEECVLWSVWFWSDGFLSTLTQKKADYRLNSQLQTYFIEVMKMAGKTVKKDQNYAKSGANSVQWVNVALSDDDVDQITQWLAQQPDFLSEYVRLVSEGYAVGVKPAREGDGYMATIISEARADGRPAMGVSAYASTPYDALGCLLYKFVSKLAGEFPSTVSQSNRKFR